MILVDTSIWIELLSGRQEASDQKMADFVTCGPIVQEILQGLRPGLDAEDFRARLLAIPVLCDPLPLHLFLAAAEIYGRGRRKGVTIRSGTDCLIAAIAIESRVPVWHRDRDFEAIAKYTPLEVVA